MRHQTNEFGRVMSEKNSSYMSKMLFIGFSWLSTTECSIPCQSSTDIIILLIILIPLPKYQCLGCAQTTNRVLLLFFLGNFFFFFFLYKGLPFQYIIKKYLLCSLAGWRIAKSHSHSHGSTELLMFLTSSFFQEILKNIGKNCNLDL